MFRNLFSSWNDSEYFYDEAEPEWTVDTAASPMVQGYNGHASMPTLAVPVAMSPAMAESHRHPPKPRVVVAETPRPIPVGPVPIGPRVDRHEVIPPPLVRAQVPPALEFKVMDFRVPLCCEGCEDRVRKKLRRYVRGVDSVHCDIYMKKVTVQGYANPAEVLRVLRKMFSRADYWTIMPVAVVKPVVVTKVVPPGAAVRI